MPAISYLGVRGDVRGLRKVILEKDLRLVQSLFLLGLPGSIFYYRIPVGKNLKGMFVGYGLCVAASLIALARSVCPQSASSALLVAVQPFSYGAALLVWTIALWTYHLNLLLQSGGKVGVSSASKAFKGQSKSRNEGWFGLLKAVSS